MTTPGGSAAANSATTRSTVSGHVGGTLTTVVLPAASAGPSFVIATATGQLNGRISAATPYGSRCTLGYAAGASISVGANAGDDVVNEQFGERVDRRVGRYNAVAV